MRKLLWAFTLVVLPLVVHAELPDFRSIVKESTPAVVKILVESKAEAPRSPEELEQLPSICKGFSSFVENNLGVSASAEIQGQVSLFQRTVILLPITMSLRALLQ